MNTSVSDGVLPFGSFDIIMLESGLSYVADNFQGDQDAKLIRTNNKNGTLRRQRVIKGPWDGSCDLQLEDKDTALPDTGFFFVADYDGDGTAEPFMVVKPGKTFTADDVTKAKCTITRCVAPVIYGSAGKTTAQLYAGLTYASAGAITTLNLEAYLPPDVVLAASTPWSAVGLPAGLSISAANGDITGTPTTPGENYVTVKVIGQRTYVKDGVAITENVTGTRTFKITIT